MPNRITIHQVRIALALALGMCLAGGASGQQVLTEQQRALIKLARAAVRAEVLGEAAPNPTAIEGPVRPVFVTIEVGGAVVGCRGRLDVHGTSLGEAVVEVARSAARHDPRYRPISAKSLKGFLVTVTVVDRLEPIESVNGLTPEMGLVLKANSRVGVVLPWEGKDPQTRLKWAYQKAGVAMGSGAQLREMIATRVRG